MDDAREVIVWGADGGAEVAALPSPWRARVVGSAAALGVALGEASAGAVVLLGVEVSRDEGAVATALGVAAARGATVVALVEDAAQPALARWLAMGLTDWAPRGVGGAVLAHRLERAWREGTRGGAATAGVSATLEVGVDGAGGDEGRESEGGWQAGALWEAGTATAAMAATGPGGRRFEHHLREVILPLGIALSAEKDFDRLLERIVIEARRICNADAGTLYLRRGETLVFEIVRTQSLGLACGGTSGRAVPFRALPLYRDGAPNYQSVATTVALDGRSIRLADIYESERFDFSSTRAFDQANSYRSRSTLAVPLCDHRGEVLGVLQLLNALDGETGEVIAFDEYHELVVESFASQASIVVNNQILQRRQRELLELERELAIAREIQSQFLPDALPASPGWRVAGRCRPARVVSGDFYDVFALPGERLALAMADVCDKGVGAAMFMALIRSLLRAFANLLASSVGEGGAGMSDPTSILRASVALTNNYLVTTHGATGMFSTLFFGVLDLTDGRLRYLNAGHNPPMLLDADGRLRERLAPGGPAVGVQRALRYRIGDVSLAPGERLVLYTDGVTEARDPAGALLGDGRLLEVLSEAREESVEGLLDRVEAAVDAHMHARSRSGDGHRRHHPRDGDDLTLLVVERARLDDEQGAW